MSSRKSAREELQSIGEILKGMGFEKAARQSSKAAFVKFLIKDAYGVEVEPPVIYSPAPTPAPATIKTAAEPKGEQLSFFPEDESA